MMSINHNLSVYGQSDKRFETNTKNDDDGRRPHCFITLDASTVHVHGSFF